MQDGRIVLPSFDAITPFNNSILLILPDYVLFSYKTILLFKGSQNKKNRSYYFDRICQNKQ